MRDEIKIKWTLGQEKDQQRKKSNGHKVITYRGCTKQLIHQIPAIFHIGTL